MTWPRWTLTLAAMLCLVASRPVSPVASAASGVMQTVPAPAAATAKQKRAAARAQEVTALQHRVTTLAAQLGDPDPARRGAAGLELMRITDRRAVPFLLDAIKAAPAEQRLPLVRALGRFKVSAKIAPFIAIAREIEWAEADPLAQEIRAQLQALGARAVGPLFAAAIRCERPTFLEGWTYLDYRSSQWMAATAGGIGPSVLSRIVREASVSSPCRRVAAVAALETFTQENQPWTETEFQQACAVLERAATDREPDVSEKATELLEKRRDDGICARPPDETATPDSGPDDETRRRAFEQALASGDPATRRGAIDRLLTGAGEEFDDFGYDEASFANPFIAPLVSDRDEELRLNAVKALHRLNARRDNWRDERKRDPDGAVPALLTAVHDANATVRRAAIDALAEVTPFGEDAARVAPELVSLVEASTSNDEEYAALLNALTTLESPAIAPRLLGWLDDKNARLRLLAARLLRSSRSAELAPRLAPLLKDPDADIRHAAAGTIRELLIMRDPPPSPEVLAALVEPMIAALNDDAIQHTAIELLGWTGDRRAVEPLLRVVPVTMNQYGCWACDAIARLGDPRAIDAVRPYLAHPNRYVRAGAASTLSHLRDDDRAVEPLTNLLRDPESDVRRAAAAALAALGRPRAIDAIRSEALSAPEASMRETAVKELRPFPSSETDATLMRVLKDPEVEVRRAAGWVLKDIARPESVPALIHALTDEDDHVRRSIAEALGKLGDRRAVDPLIRVLPHALPEAATALATLGEEARVKTILKTLCDPAAKLEGCLLLSDSLRPSRP